MSIKAMTWAFGLPLEPRAKIALLAIADNARDDGVAWPSKDTIADKSSQSRATVGRRLKSLEALGVLACFARYREDGSQTSDEIRLNLDISADDVLRKLHDAGEDHHGENDEETGSAEPTAPDKAERDRGCQADTPPLQSGYPGAAVVTGGGLQSCNPQDEPSSEPSKIPPSPPPGGGVVENEVSEEVKKRFDYFLTNCLGYRTQDPERPLRMFRLLDEAEQIACAAASPLHAAELAKAKKKSLDAWKLIRERYWTRYPEARLPERPPEPVWIDEGPDIDALRVLGAIIDRGPPKLIHDEVKGTGLLRGYPIPDDLRGLASFEGGDVLDWIVVEPDTREFNAWRHRIHDWTGQWTEARIVMRRGKKMMAMLPGRPPLEVQDRIRGIPVPCRWPPKKDGTLYADSNEGDAV